MKRKAPAREGAAWTTGAFYGLKEAKNERSCLTESKEKHKRMNERAVLRVQQGEKPMLTHAMPRKSAILPLDAAGSTYAPALPGGWRRFSADPRPGDWCFQNPERSP
jgi:hypothetical protein